MRKSVCRNIVFALALTVASSTAGIAQENKESISLFKLSDVQLKDEIFLHAQNLNKNYLLTLDPDRLLAPYLREAGLKPRKINYTNWENTGLDGHIGGHYISALALLYAASGDQKVYARLDYALKELQKCQDNLGTGYIGGVPGSKQLWEDVKQGKIRAGGFDLNSRWVPLYNIHKIYAGLRDAYYLVGRDDAKQMLIKLMDWTLDLVSNLSDAQIQDMLRSEHGGLNEIFADAAVIANNDQYLKLAERFTHLQILNPLIQQKDELTGKHANTQIPKIIGAKRIADLQGRKDWDNGARYFWDNVVTKRTVAIGGNSASEHFHPSDNFSNMMSNIEGPETCNTYNMMKLSTQFFQSDGDSKYVDYYERAMYNHILSSQHPVHGGLVYFTQMRPSHYRVYSQPQTSFWCCVGSGIENHSKYGEFIYAHRNNELFVNLFVASELNWKEKGIQLIQQTTFPQEGQTTFILKTKKSIALAVKVRYPSWLPENGITIKVNGKNFIATVDKHGYISIDRQWKNGDIVNLNFQMEVNVEQLPDQSEFYAFRYGPIVLAAKTNDTNMTGLIADDSRGGHIAKGDQISMTEIPHLVTSTPNEQVEMVSAKDLRFKLKSLQVKNQATQMELMPFYQLHDSRYIIYWPRVESSNQLTEQLVKYEKDNRQRRLNTITVDQIQSGQQQSESDHGIQYHESNIGSDNGVQWRNATGWFSYIMNNKNTRAKYLWISDLEGTSKDFDVLVNDALIKPEIINTAGKYYKLQDGTEKNIIILKAKQNQTTPKIKEIRLLTEIIE
ncbi:glycoside hydrolase family 127 protein [Sphingobacterium sp. WQ 366]|uniref:Glycoside hydrolase family 127 protein n=2 Tax=Sphingobacterium bovistauri TaxID=2781959 RepID=A0ABS7Z4Y2_9SPHI|nr:glycoside hydrolase family 127 protein [Sphingobacterium bovistauri]